MSNIPKYNQAKIDSYTSPFVLNSSLQFVVVLCDGLPNCVLVIHSILPSFVYIFVENILNSIWDFGMTTKISLNSDVDCRQCSKYRKLQQYHRRLSSIKSSIKRTQEFLCEPKTTPGHKIVHGLQKLLVNAHGCYFVNNEPVLTL